MALVINRQILSTVIQRPPAENGVLLFEGDSITFGFGVTTNQRFSNLVVPRLGGNFTMSNIAESGRTVGVPGDVHPNMIEHGVTADLSWNKNSHWGPTSNGARCVYFITGGVNDISAGATHEELTSYLTQVCSDRKQTGWNRIIVSTIYGASGGVTDTVNEWLRDPDRIRNGLFDVLCDVAADPLMADRDNTTVYQDSTHPTAAGHAVIAEYVGAAISLATGVSFT